MVHTSDIEQIETTGFEDYGFPKHLLSKPFGTFSIPKVKSWASRFSLGLPKKLHQFTQYTTWRQFMGLPTLYHGSCKSGSWANNLSNLNEINFASGPEVTLLWQGFMCCVASTIVSRATNTITTHPTPSHPKRTSAYHARTR